MTRVIQTIIDESGNVNLDFEGFAGDDCVLEERRLREGLAALGLRVDAPSPRRKAAAAARGSGTEIRQEG